MQVYIYNMNTLQMRILNMYHWFQDIIHGKLDQKNSQLEVDYAIGRDIRPGDVGIIVSTLQDWCNACDAVLGCVEVQIQRANTEKNKIVKHKEVIEQEVSKLTFPFCCYTTALCEWDIICFDRLSILRKR